MKFSNKAYDVLKYVSLIGLPALATFVAAIGVIWDVQNTDNVVKTIVACNVLLSSLTLVTNTQYNRSGAKFDGFIDIQRMPAGQDDQITNLELPHSISESTANGELVLKVRPTA